MRDRERGQRLCEEWNRTSSFASRALNKRLLLTALSPGPTQSFSNYFSSQRKKHGSVEFTNIAGATKTCSLPNI